MLAAANRLEIAMGPTSHTNSVALDSVSTPQRPLITTRGRVFLVVALALVAFSWRFAEVRPGVLLRPATLAAIWNFVSRLFPPDLSSEFLRSVLRAVAQTIAIAIAGTALSLTVALPLGVLATGTLWNRGVLVAIDDRLAYRLGWIASRLARIILGFLRAVPDLVWALLFVAAVGLGSLAGTLALALAYSGVLGRVYADVFEHVDPLPLEALQSTGATRMQIFLRGVWPQALPHLIAYTLYSFECCVRAAAVLGFVGAGGIGYEISLSMRMFEYGQVLTLILAFVVLLAATDLVSRKLRERLQSNSQRDPGFGAAFSWGGGSDLISRDKAAHPRPFRKSWRVAQVGLFAIILLASFYFAGFSPNRLAGDNILRNVFRFCTAMVPPDLARSFVLSLGPLVAQTIAIAILGTLMGVIIGGILAIPATSTLTLVRRGSPGAHPPAERGIRWTIFWTARLLLNFLRSIPDLVWALICILLIGIGPFAGTLAIGLHTAGVLGKLYAETLEEVPQRPVEALRALGSGPF